jgi:hypothetical protein
MGSLTNFLENELLDHVLNNAAYTPAATLYLALATGDPGEAATGASMSEVPNSGNYSRKAITVGAGMDNAYLYLFTAAPTVADDNAPFVITLTNLVGVMKLALQPAIQGGTIWASAAGDVWAFQCASSSADLWGVLVVGDAWTPTAQQAFTISLHVDRQ